MNSVDFNQLKFKEIKKIVSNINIEEDYNSELVKRYIDLLLSDSRKNVVKLGESLQKNRDKIMKEISRVKEMYAFDKNFGNYQYIAGVDEVGRGPLAGPIVSCAVILDLNAMDDELILWLNDSKKISEKKREELAQIIKEKALAYHIAQASNEEIDSKGIAYCNNNVFLEACYGLKIKPDLVLSDGYLVKNITIENKYVIKGDAKSATIAAASILAKVYRDNLMKEYSKKYPEYYFDENAGYGTVKHVEALKTIGPCEIHRKSFLTKIL